MDTKSPYKYLLRPQKTTKYRFAYIGVPHDAATHLGNPGARFGPQAMRNELKGVFDWRLQNYQMADIDEGIIDLSSVEIADFGDVDLSYYDTDLTVTETYKTVLTALESGYFPLVVGGDHAVTYPSVKALHDTRKDAIGIIHVDAHCDLFDYSKRQGRFSCSSPMRRSIELERLSGHNLVQVGLRGYTTIDQYEVGQKLGVRRITARQFNEIGVRTAAKQALDWASDGTQSIYLTIDLDVLNPGEAPGTGWPEPAGFTGQQLLDFVRIVSPHIAAIDITELNPLTDSHTRTTAIFAARLLLDFITVRSRL